MDSPGDITRIDKDGCGFKVACVDDSREAPQEQIKTNFFFHKKNPNSFFLKEGLVITGKSFFPDDSFSTSTTSQRKSRRVKKI